MAVAFIIPKGIIPDQMPATWQEVEEIKSKIRTAERQLWADQPESVRREALLRPFSATPPGLSQEEVESMEML